MKLLTFALGAALLIGLGMLANDPLWTWWSSLLAAAAAWLTAPRALDVWLRRRVTPASIVAWYVGTCLPVDVTQVAVLGTWRPDLTIGNAVAATPLFLAVGLVAIVDLRRHWLPAGAAAACCTVALLSWVPW